MVSEDAQVGHKESDTWHEIGENQVGHRGSYTCHENVEAQVGHKGLDTQYEDKILINHGGLDVRQVWEVLTDHGGLDIRHIYGSPIGSWRTKCQTCDRKPKQVMEDDQMFDNGKIPVSQG